MLKKMSLFFLLALASCSTKSEKDPTYLLVITSKHGEIKKNARGNFELILDHEHVEKVVAFADRPYRIVKEMTSKELQLNWKEGRNSFADDPPNAAVIIDQHLQTVVLHAIRTEGTKTIFEIKQDSSQNLVEKSGVTQLFIDGWNLCFSSGNCA